MVDECDADWYEFFSAKREKASNSDEEFRVGDRVRVGDPELDYPVGTVVEIIDDLIFIVGVEYDGLVIDGGYFPPGMTRLEDEV